MNYLLDTNIISELVSKEPNKKVVAYINNLNQGDVYLSVITIGEIQVGIQNIQSDSRKAVLLKWLYSDLFKKFENKIISIDINIMLIWGNINHQLKKVGKPLPIMDSLIAATCIQNKYTLITRNEKDFKNLEMDIINPF